MVLVEDVAGVLVCVPDAVSDTADATKPTEDTSLNEAANVTLLFSQEHGEPSGEQQ